MPLLLLVWASLAPMAALPSSSAVASLRKAAAAQAAEYAAVYSLLCSHGSELGLAECRLTDIAFGIQSLLRLQPLLERWVDEGPRDDEIFSEDDGLAAQLEAPVQPPRRLRLPSWLLPWRGTRQGTAPGVEFGLERSVSLPRALRCLELSNAAYGPFGALLVGTARGQASDAARMLAERAAWRRPNAAAFEAMSGLSARGCLLFSQWQPTGSFHDATYVPAHYIVLDLRLRAVVLVIRGSLGLRDAFVDLQTVRPAMGGCSFHRGCGTSPFAETVGIYTDMSINRCRNAVVAHDAFAQSTPRPVAVLREHSSSPPRSEVRVPRVGALPRARVPWWHGRGCFTARRDARLPHSKRVGRAARMVSWACSSGTPPAASLPHEGALCPTHLFVATPRDRELLLTGHSLGGGVASFAAKLLRAKLPRRMSVSAIVFAPPAILPLSECSAAYDKLVDGYICGADVVPRLSIGSLRHL